MSGPATDVTTTVEYSTDKWFMDRVPWALWTCTIGLVIVLHSDDPSGNGAVLAVVYLALLGMAFAGWALTTLIARYGISSFLELPVHLLIFAFVVVIVAAVAGSVGDTVAVSGRLNWSMLIDPPGFVFGWMLLYLGLGWIAFAVFRHFRPARPVLSLTTAGVSFRRLGNLLVPWQDIHAVGPVQLGGIPAANPNVIVVAVSKQFYEQHVAPRRSFFEPPGAEYMFRPIGEMMQMALTSADVRVDPEGYRVPAEARWKAFRDRPRSTPPVDGPAGRRVVFGRWSIDGTLWQAIWFVAPLFGMLAVVLVFLFGATS